ncbi:SpaH/EbpB family LPXTG-anchored major pilin [Lacticaseibacillus zhaodongensis]|uniref:SpaH/EbpB family LPXTG-anchored major pilin n=1 Tax=Lacticaseibacillus zhaodongensis TaxID=2668065 RepID=UPI0012D3633B|nr:SpaH/EbpB family LPXTG-anchored major pilin [Lacticaseibacillus zhaodongensis]
MKNATISKSWTTLMASALVLSTLGGMMASATSVVMAAGPDEVEVVVHKKDGSEFEGLVQNTGEIMTDFDGLPAITGAGFTVYDLSEEFYTEYNKEGHDSAAAYQHLRDNFYTLIENKVPVAGEQLTAGTDGSTTFTLDRKDGKGRHAIYGIDETTIPDKMTGSAPMIVGLPANTSDGIIHLYPKNHSGVKKQLKNPDAPGNFLDEGAIHGFEIGQELTYQVTFNVPGDIGTPGRYTQMTLSDAMTAAGANMLRIDSMQIGGMSVLAELGPANSFANYKVTSPYDETPGADNLTNEAAGWEMSYNLSDKTVRDLWAKYEGKALTIEYTVKLNGDMVVDNEVDNEFTFKLDHRGGSTTQMDDGADVTTGGIHYVKIDSKDQQKLGEAKFVLRNKAGKYAKFTGPTADPVKIEWVDAEADGTPIITGSDGVIAIAGLAYAEYTLVETEAPNGYITPTGTDRETTFTVAKGTYTVDAIRQIKNVPDSPGSLPSTGGIGVITLLVVGGGLMGAAALKRKREDEA